MMMMMMMLISDRTMYRFEKVGNLDYMIGYDMIRDRMILCRCWE
jgi:hypothetical protein